MELVERVEKLLLAAALVAEKLDVVYEENVHAPVLGLEFLGFVVLDRLNKFVDEFLRAHVGHLVVRVPVEDVMSYSVHQVRLAETDTSPYEKRIIAFPGVSARQGGRMGKTVRLAHDKRMKDPGIQVPSPRNVA